jgi:hypothetical protein
MVERGKIGVRFLAAAESAAESAANSDSDGE